MKIVIDEIEIIQNGDVISFDETFTIEDVYIKDLGWETDMIAVEFNGNISYFDVDDYIFQGRTSDDLSDYIRDEVLYELLDFEYGEYGNIIQNFEIGGCRITLLDDDGNEVNQWTNY